MAIALGFWVVVLFSAPDDRILPFLATVTFRVGPVAVGVLLAAASAGLLAGLPFVRPAGRRLGVTRAIVAGFAIMATGNLLTAAAPWLMAAFAAQMLRGLAIPPGRYPRDDLASAHDTTPAARPGPGQRLRRGGRRGSRRLPHRRPAGGCQLPAHSLRDSRLRWPGRRGHHCRTAPQGALSARDRIAAAAPPSAPDDERRSAGRGEALTGAGSSDLRRRRLEI
jgi:hypothetical protein